MITLTLTEREAEYVKDILDIWIEGYKDTNDLLDADKSVDNFEDLLTLSGGLHTNLHDAENIRQRLWEATSGDSNARAA